MRCKCGKEFSCNIQEGKTNCWCMDLPYLLAEYLPDKVGKDCLCYDCVSLFLKKENKPTGKE